MPACRGQGVQGTAVGFRLAKVARGYPGIIPNAVKRSIQSEAPADKAALQTLLQLSVEVFHLGHSLDRTRNERLNLTWYCL
jgi:hypothetical protein